MRTDADLAAAFQGGDDRAFSLLYERYRRALYVFALKMLGDADAAGDLVQDAFLRAHEKRGQLRRPECFRSWLFAIGRNRCMTQFRQTPGMTPLEDAPEEAIAVEPAADSIEALEDIGLIRRSLDGLRPEYREVLVLREYQNMSYREIADITGTTESAVRSKLFKARRALHDKLKPSFAGRRQP